MRTPRWLRAQGAAARAAIVVLPIFSVAVGSLVFLGPGGVRPVTGARVRGAPVEGAHAVAVRVEVVRALYEVLDSGGENELLVEATAPGQTLRAWHGSTGPDGIAEVRVEASAPIVGPVALAVSALGPHPRVLAAGEVRLGSAPPRAITPAQVVGFPRGDLEMRVQTTRGVLAAPFAETVRVSVTPPERTDLEVSGPGLETSPSRATTNEGGVASFAMTPLAHQIELSVEARAGGKAGHWEGTLPVIPGAMWLSPSPDTGARALISAVPRERAYVSFWTEEGRVGGAVVPLAKDARGFYAGEVTVPDAPDVRAAHMLYASVAGDPLEIGAGTVGWPIRPAEGAVTTSRMALLLDGLPAAQQREQDRAAAARRAGLILIGATAVLEVLLLLAQGRASQRRLEAHLREASEAMPAADRARLMIAAREHPLLYAVLATALVGLAFALVAALSTFR